MLESLKKIVASSDAAGQLIKGIREGNSFFLQPVPAGFLAMLISAVFRRTKRTVVVVAPEKTEDILADIELVEKRTLYFPAYDILPYDTNLPDTEIVARRIETVYRMRESPRQTIVTSPRALLEKSIPERLLRPIKIHRGETVELEELKAKLVENGYKSCDTTGYIGEFSSRGGILDIFTPGTVDPVRLEFFGDTVESIRLFSARSQRSIRKIKECTILPPTEAISLVRATRSNRIQERMNPDIAQKLPKGEIEKLVDRLQFDPEFPGYLWFAPLFSPEANTLLDYLPEDTIFIITEEEELRRQLSEFESEANELYTRKLTEKIQPLPPELIFADKDKLIQQIEHRQHISFGLRGKGSLPVFPQDTIGGDIALLRETLKRYNRNGYETIILCDNVGQAERMKNLIGAVPFALEIAPLSEGFIFTEGKLAAFTDNGIFARYRRRIGKRRYHEGTYDQPVSLEPGDYLVHIDYGIGRFVGIENLTIGDITTECIVLEYDMEDKLYVPSTDFHLLQRYEGKTANIKLARLTSDRWKRTKKKVKQKVTELAGELLEIYTLRHKLTGIQHKGDEALFNQLEASFIYDETEDQARAIEEVLLNMGEPYPMDRLLTGDVGFGKTEVAIRAAFRAVLSGYQVAVLVPTTILAEQHTATFTERLSDFPVIIEMLSRFRTRREQNQIIEKLREGKIDIVIGTHRLLSADVDFKKLGLLIIDEEQKFGVRDKEKIKRLKLNIDVLSMSATPIPRTLYLSLSGARDMSFINTPPQERRPIYTQIIEFNPKLFKMIIRRELDRGGQVFFLHNSINSIGTVAKLLRETLPDVRLAIGHGRMDEQELEKTFLDFLDRRFDLLLSTTIIESGTDIPNVNTIIINHADKLGLADLYQLRGRVGRSKRQAYCYLVAPPYHRMSSKARARLKAILAHTSLGSGLNIAMRDLEIRGAGNLLGKQQSGFIDAIGFELYNQLLSEAVKESKGEKKEPFIPVPFQTSTPVFIPQGYIPPVEKRMRYYQRIYTAESIDKLHRINEEIKDIFGSPPDEVKTLFEFAEIRILAKRLPISRIMEKSGRFSIYFETDFTPPWHKISTMFTDIASSLNFKTHPVPCLIIEPEKDASTFEKMRFFKLQIERLAAERFLV